MSLSRDVLRIFIPLAITASAVLFVSYVNEQQILRGDANEPQKGMAEDLANSLANAPLSTYTPNGMVPIESSLSPWLVVYDSYGNAVSGTGYLDGALPALPSGIFDIARTKGEDVLTWQPQTSVRSAIVVVPISGTGGFVVGGRSLTYVEQQESLLTKRSALGWLAVMFAVLVGSWGAVWFLRK